MGSATITTTRLFNTFVSQRQYFPRHSGNSTKQTELSQTIVNQQARSLLPSNEPPMFYGDDIEYPLFMTAFESLIESKVEDSYERLYFLVQ